MHSVSANGLHLRQLKSEESMYFITAVSFSPSLWHFLLGWAPRKQLLCKEFCGVNTLDRGVNSEGAVFYTCSDWVCTSFYVQIVAAETLVKASVGEYVMCTKQPGKDTWGLFMKRHHTEVLTGATLPTQDTKLDLICLFSAFVKFKDLSAGWSAK